MDVKKKKKESFQGGASEIKKKQGIVITANFTTAMVAYPKAESIWWFDSDVFDMESSSRVGPPYTSR